MSEKIQPRPVEKWTFDRPDGTIEVCDLYTGLPLRGLDFDKIPGPISPSFEKDFDLKDGFRLWGEEPIEVGYYATDPSDPDGLNYELFMDLASSANMVGFAHSRSVLFAARQHGIDALAPGMLLDNPQPNPQYEAQLKEALRRLGRPTFSFDPSLNTSEGIGDPGYDKVFALQQARNLLYDAVREEASLTAPSRKFVGLDIAYAHQQKSWMTGGVGTRVIDTANDPKYDMYGDLPERLILVGAPEHMGIANNIEALGGMAMIGFADADGALGNHPEYKQYDDAGRAGYIPPVAA